MKCLNCINDVPQTPKKRAKLYCSPKCRVEYCRNKKPKGKVGRPKKNAEYGKKIAQTVFNSSPPEPRDLSKVKGIADPILVKETIEREITDIKAEKIPATRDTPMGRKSWALDQKKRIQELEKQLNGINL